MNPPLLSLNSLLRALMALGGVALFVLALPVARGAWLAQKDDAFYAKVRTSQPYGLDETHAGIALIDAAVAASPSASRLVQRSELLGALAANMALKVTDDQRLAWRRQARADLEAGLADDPARSLDWLRLAIIHSWLDGPTRKIAELLLVSIDTGRMMSPLWPSRMRMILDNWGYFTDEEKARLNDYIVMTWRQTDDRRWFGRAVYDPFDEVILRYLLRDVPKAQEELSKWILDARKK